MDEDINDDIFHKKKLDDDSSSVHTDVPSDPWFDNQDMNCLSPSNDLNERNECNNHELSFIYSNNVNEPDQKENEVDLYSDLIMLEETEKNSRLKSNAELEKLKVELEKLKEADAAKSVKIAELTKENTNLKKSICSLYQTVKSEIEHKDKLLAEANRKIDTILFRKNSQKYRNDKADESKNSCSSNDPSDKGQHKRKRSTESPKSSLNEKRKESGRVNDKDSHLETNRNKRQAFEKNANTPKEHRTQSSQSDSNCKSGLQTPEAAEFLESSRDCTETNNLFYRLVPSPLKKSFHDYEQSQIVSLNKLKQSLINEYFDNNAGHGSSSKTYNSKEFPKRHPSSVNSSFLLTPCSEKNDDSPRGKKIDYDAFQKRGKITRSMQEDVVSLFRYNKEKVPFLDKRKFGLLNNGKELFPENS